MRRIFDVYETLLADGREWIAGTPGVSRADIEGAWVLDWVLGMKGAVPEELFGEKVYPATRRWVARFRGVVKEERTKGPEIVEIKGARAIEHVLSSEVDGDETVDERDPLGLKRGETVQVWPIDTGFNHKDRGRLVKLTKDEVVIAVASQTAGKEVYLHAPRWGFRIARDTGGNGVKL